MMNLQSSVQSLREKGGGRKTKFDQLVSFSDPLKIFQGIWQDMKLFLHEIYAILAQTD